MKGRNRKRDHGQKRDEGYRKLANNTKEIMTACDLKTFVESSGWISSKVLVCKLSQHNR
jgi:hypothetical protein